MVQEVPANEVGTKVVRVNRTHLHALLDRLHDNRNIIKISHEPDGARYVVTVEYAIMDLALQLGSVNGFIERMADEVNDRR